MTLTTSFRDTLKARLQSDEEFRDGFFREGIELLLSGDVTTGKAILRDYINATVGFKSLGEITHTSSKSLMRMFSEKGNPQAKNLFAVISHLQEENGIHLEVTRKHKVCVPMRSRQGAVAAHP
jgi:DNA-binding phage protein